MEHNDILKNIGNQTVLFTFDFCQECVKISYFFPPKKVIWKPLKITQNDSVNNLPSFTCLIYLFVYLIFAPRFEKNIILYSTEQRQGE